MWARTAAYTYSRAHGHEHEGVSGGSDIDVLVAYIVPEDCVVCGSGAGVFGRMQGD